MFLRSHASYERRWPDEALWERSYERDRTTNGLPATREFPCPGSLVAVERVGPIWTVECSECPFTTTIRSPERPPARRTQTTSEGSTHG